VHGRASKKALLHGQKHLALEQKHADAKERHDAEEEVGRLRDVAGDGCQQGLDDPAALPVDALRNEDRCLPSEYARQQERSSRGVDCKENEKPGRRLPGKYGPQLAKTVAAKHDARKQRRYEHDIDERGRAPKRRQVGYGGCAKSQRDDQPYK
jgi:hypothetical protein